MGFSWDKGAPHGIVVERCRRGLAGANTLMAHAVLGRTAHAHGGPFAEVSREEEAQSMGTLTTASAPRSLCSVHAMLERRPEGRRLALAFRAALPADPFLWSQDGPACRSIPESAPVCRLPSRPATAGTRQGWSVWGRPSRRDAQC